MLVPLAKQEVHPDDSVLAPFRNPFSGKGLIIDYPGLIKQAFQNKWWNAPGTVKKGDKFFTHMEANFSLFWGLAIQCYEQTLVSDDSPFDRFAQGRTNALTRKQKAGLEIPQESRRAYSISGRLVLESQDA